eukprot:4450562-Amphidinium_carterae.2
MADGRMHAEMAVAACCRNGKSGVCAVQYWMSQKQCTICQHFGMLLCDCATQYHTILDLGYTAYTEAQSISKILASYCHNMLMRSACDMPLWSEPHQSET